MNQPVRKEGPTPAHDAAERPAPVDLVRVTGGPDIIFTGLFVLAVFYTLYFAREVLLPVTLALLLMLILQPAVRGLKSLWIPEPVGAALVVVTLLASLGFGLSLLIDPATKWIERAPHMLSQVEAKFWGVKKSVAEITKAAKKVEEIATLESNKKPQIAADSRNSLLNRIFTGTQSVLISTVTTIVLLYFLLASGDMFLRKVVRVTSTFTQKKRTVEFARAVEADMARYLLIVTCINAGLGVVTSAALYLLGMPNPMLWGTMVALLNFLPYIGAGISLVVIATVAFLTFDSAAQIFSVPLVFLGLTALEGQILTPTLTGRRLTMNPVVVFLSMLFWAWLWGAIGALLAVPILMTFKILCDHVESLAPVSEFLTSSQAESDLIQ